VPGIITDAALAVRFWAKVQKGPGCWLWTAYRNRDGYGQFRVGGRMSKAHRVSWMLHFGPIPGGLDVLHRCDNPDCVNPSHLWLGTDADHTADKVAKGRQSRQKGEMHGQAKLCAAEVITIRRAGL
jgi:hypothetical protein